MRDRYKKFQFPIQGASQLSLGIPSPGANFRLCLHSIIARVQLGAAGTALIININFQGGPNDIDIANQANPNDWVTVQYNWGDEGLSAVPATAIGIVVTAQGSAGNNIKGVAVYSIERSEV